MQQVLNGALLALGVLLLLVLWHALGLPLPGV